MSYNDKYNIKLLKVFQDAVSDTYYKFSPQYSTIGKS